MYISYMSTMRSKISPLTAVRLKKLRSPNVSRSSIGKLGPSTTSGDPASRPGMERIHVQFEPGVGYVIPLKGQAWKISNVGFDNVGQGYPVAKFSKLLKKAVEVNIATARSQMPEMVKRSAKGEYFVIRNARTKKGPVAVLIGTEELGKIVEKMSGSITERTIGDIRKSLPFAGFKVESMTAQALPGAGLSSAILPE